MRFQNSWTQFVVGVFFALGAISPAYALPSQYRCQGRVQYYPCEVRLFEKKKNPEAVVKPKPGQPRSLDGLVADPTLFAEVEKASYEPTVKNQGWWRGTVRGNGLVALELQILRAGKVVEARSMGQVPLKNKATWFSFRSPRPKGTRWSWKILARPRA